MSTAYCSLQKHTITYPLASLHSTKKAHSYAIFYITIYRNTHSIYVCETVHNKTHINISTAILDSTEAHIHMHKAILPSIERHIPMHTAILHSCRYTHSHAQCTLHFIETHIHSQTAYCTVQIHTFTSTMPQLTLQKQTFK